MNEKIGVRCDYCGQKVAVYFASNGQHFCSEEHREYYIARTVAENHIVSGRLENEADASHHFQLGNE